MLQYNYNKELVENCKEGSYFIQNSLKYMFCVCVFNIRKKFIQVWNNMMVSKWQNCHFWVNYFFNSQQMQRSTLNTKNTGLWASYM